MEVEDLESRVLELGWKLWVKLEYLQELEQMPGVVVLLQIL